MASSLEYQQSVLDHLQDYADLSFPKKATLAERLLIRHASPDNLHPNPDDEFSDPAVGPNFEDEVLFVSPATHKTEPPLIFPLNRIFKERLRLGTAILIPELRREGFEVWVYTTSFRSELYIRTLFRFYGIRFDGIVNGQRHQKEVQGDRRDPMPNKLPSFYHITLHIDDEAIVATYGKTYGFDVYQLDAQDDDWAEKIMDRVRTIKKNKF